MAQAVIPSTSRSVAAEALKGALMNAGLGDWVVPTSEDHYASHLGLSGAPLNAFDQSSSDSSLTVTIQTGEAYVGGAWLGIDVTTDVTLASGTPGQQVAVGPQYQTSDGIRIDLVQNFTAEEDSTVIWEFDTDSSGVTNVENRRNGEPDVPRSTADETIPGSWSFTSQTTIQDTLRIENTSTHIVIEETDTDTIHHIEGSNQNLNLFNPNSDGIIRIRGEDGNVAATEGSGTGIVVTSGDEKLELQVDGNNGQGIINFITQ